MLRKLERPWHPNPPREEGEEDDEEEEDDEPSNVNRSSNWQQKQQSEHRMTGQRMTVPDKKQEGEAGGGETGKTRSSFARNEWNKIDKYYKSESRL